VLTRLERFGVELGPGLTDEEVEAAEGAYSLEFPPDLRALLQRALPQREPWEQRKEGAGGHGTPPSPTFPDWRDLDNAYIRDRLQWPTEGVLFDVERNDFWMAEWGEPPLRLDEALALAARKVAEAPRLVPVAAHRYIPTEPHLEGNPVISVYQTDIIYYGRDLADYFRNEYHDTQWRRFTGPFRKIRFWDYFLQDEHEQWSEAEQRLIPQATRSGGSRR